MIKSKLTKNHSDKTHTESQLYISRDPAVIWCPASWLVDWQWSSNPRWLMMNIRRYIWIPAGSVFFGCDETSRCLRREWRNNQTTTQKLNFFYILTYGTKAVVQILELLQLLYSYYLLFLWRVMNFLISGNNCLLDFSLYMNSKYHKVLQKLIRRNQKQAVQRPAQTS